MRGIYPKSAEIPVFANVALIKLLVAVETGSGDLLKETIMFRDRSHLNNRMKQSDVYKELIRLAEEEFEMSILVKQFQQDYNVLTEDLVTRVFKSRNDEIF